MANRRKMESTIRGIVSRIAAEYSPQRVILFGSHAAGTAGPDSDIDLLIIKDTMDSFPDRWSKVRRILTDPHRTHPLETLLNDALAHDSSLEELRPLCQDATSFYIVQRYPYPTVAGLTDCRSG